MGSNYSQPGAEPRRRGELEPSCSSSTKAYRVMYDLTTVLQVLIQYTTGVMVLALTFYCWHLDRRGRATKTLKTSYVALCCLLLLFMALPLIGVAKLPSYFF